MYKILIAIPCMDQVPAPFAQSLAMIRKGENSCAVAFQMGSLIYTSRNNLAKKAIEDADLVLFVCDGSESLTDDDRLIIDLCTEHQNAIALINKSDVGQKVLPSDLPFMYVIEISAANGDGLALLADTVDTMFAGDMPCDGSILTNARQFDACRRAHEAILRALQALQQNQTPDLALTDVEAAMEAMGEVTGATVREDITARIFERFCVGK